MPTPKMRGWHGPVNIAEGNIPALANLYEDMGNYIGQRWPATIFFVPNGWVFNIFHLMPRRPDLTILGEKIYCRAELSAEQKRVVLNEIDIWTVGMGLNLNDDEWMFESSQRAFQGTPVPRLFMARYAGEDINAGSIEVPPDSEAALRGFFRKWKECMEGDPPAKAAPKG